MEKLTNQELCDKGKAKLNGLENIMEEAARRASNNNDAKILAQINEVRCCLLDVHTLAASLCVDTALKIGGK